MERELTDDGMRSKYLAAIGEVAAMWSLFEAIIDTQSIKLVKLDPHAGVCFTAQIAGSARKLDAYISLAHLLKIPEALHNDLKAFAGSVYDLGEKRNRIVHDVWVFDQFMQAKRLQSTAKKTVVIKEVPVSDKEILDVSKQIEKFIRRFEVLSKQVHSHEKGQPDTAPPGTPP